MSYKINNTLQTTTVGGTRLIAGVDSDIRFFHNMLATTKLDKSTVLYMNRKPLRLTPTTKYTLTASKFYCTICLLEKSFKTMGANGKDTTPVKRK